MSLSLSKSRSGLIAIFAALMLVLNSPAPASQAVVAQAPTAGPSAAPAASAASAAPAASAATEYHLCAAIADQAVSQSDAKTALGVLEYRLGQLYGGHLRFDDENKDGTCPDKASVELTYGRLRTQDDNYVVIERRFEGVDIGAILRAADRSILAQSPLNAASPYGAYYDFRKTTNQVAFLALTGLASILNAKNTNKTAASEVTFLGGFSSVKLPTYHQSDAQFELLLGAAMQVACDLARSGRMPDQPTNLGPCAHIPGG